jgi:hypothetical protein
MRLVTLIEATVGVSDFLVTEHSLFQVHRQRAFYKVMLGRNL